MNEPRVSQYKQWLLFLAVVLIARMVMSTMMPLTDFSEARYAEIARKILVHDDWITLWFKPDVPFWGKPPMAFWGVAASFATFGISEFAARLPSLLYTLMTAAIMFAWVRGQSSRPQALAACTIYLGSWITLQTSGAVITDPLLVLTTTAVMVCFWHAIVDGDRKAALLMWLALGAGLLAKGPLALVLSGLACGIWVLIFGQWRRLFKYGQWLAGLPLMLLIAVPWYYLAERRTPGFLDYFIVGEHFQRYIVPEWPGDMYGGVKQQPIGMIWLYFLAGWMPWSLIAIVRAFRKSARTSLVDRYRSAPSLTGYLMCWMLLPLVFFLPARNILATYIMPAIPAAAILLATRFESLTVPRRYLYATAALGVILFFAAEGVAWVTHYDNHRYNQRPIIRAYEALAERDPGPLIYTGAYRFSAVFYTRDHVIFTARPAAYYTDSTFYVAIRDMWKKGTTAGLPARCTEQLAHSEFSLWYCPGDQGR